MGTQESQPRLRLFGSFKGAGGSRNQSHFLPHHTRIAEVLTVRVICPGSGDHH